MNMRRVLLTVVSAILAALAGKDAALAYWRIQDQTVASAPKALAGDPMLNVRRAESYLSNPGLFAARADAVSRNARAALRSEPLDAMALRQLGVAAARQQADAGASPLALAERISRRDLPGQILLIEKSAQDGDVAAVLAHYDRALLTYPTSDQHLFPVLAKALSDAEIRSALGKYATRAWTRDFLGKAIDLGSDPAAVTGLLADLRVQLSPRDTQTIATALIGQLMARGQYADVRDLVRQMPGGALQLIDRIAFSTETSNSRLAPLSWTFVNDDGFETALDGTGGLAIRVSSEKTGMAAQRVTLLAPARYQLTQSVSYVSGNPRAALSWEVRCLGDASSGPILQQLLPVADGDKTYRSTFTVPQTCTAQSWQLMALAAETQFASTAVISGLSLVKQ